jgi:hypothetical protein
MGLGINDMKEESFSSWYFHGKPEYFQKLGKNNITKVFTVE